MDSTDAGPAANSEKAKEAEQSQPQQAEESSPEAALRAWLAPYGALLSRGATVAAGSAALVTAAGVLVAGPSFARAGVPFAKLPLLLLSAAGLNFAITTVGALYSPLRGMKIVGCS